ncbi:hypothetical protein CLV62_13722 [Dysgonomonas alginatilytica]|uniref:Uncharacterized protein n=1 Tax=Dysgonomonas alginatilytica TaxID=1605892 RepID=A0A2V3PKX7_9BACT|nr:hypothetical protein [Dysgonomonas alginatilytica]PXV59356.1 hypothetical protein CLV62_13722 [Dysgonomonas alginatilytica]
MKTKDQTKRVLGLEEISQSENSEIYGGKSLSDKLRDLTVFCCIDIPPMG